MKKSKSGQPSDRFQFETFRDRKVKIDKEGKEGKVRPHSSTTNKSKLFVVQQNYKSLQN